jgi:hypothetical protein
MITVFLDFEQVLSIIKLRIPGHLPMSKLLELSKSHFEIETCQIMDVEGKKYIEDVISDAIKVNSLKMTNDVYLFHVTDLHPKDREVKKEMVSKLDPDSTKIPESYKCPINKSILNYKATTLKPCNHSIEKSRWKFWKNICDQKGNLTCPVCSTDVTQIESISLEKQKEIAQYVKNNISEPFSSNYWKEYQLYLHVITIQKTYAKKKKEKLPMIVNSPFDKSLDGRFASDPRIWFIMLGDNKARLLDLITTVNLNLYIKEHPECLIVETDDSIFDLDKLKHLRGNQIHHLMPFYATETFVELMSDRSSRHSIWETCGICGAIQFCIKKLKINDCVHEMDVFSSDPKQKEIDVLKDIDDYHKKRDSVSTEGNELSKFSRKRYKWMFEFLNGNFHDYYKGDSIILEKAFLEGKNSITLTTKGTLYRVDFVLMTQKNMSTKRVRKVQRVGF